jgi:hypothetical protein
MKEVVHGFDHESLEAKASWFRTLSIPERLQRLSEMYELAIALNPRLREGQDAQRAATSVLILELPRS